MSDMLRLTDYPGLSPVEAVKKIVDWFLCNYEDPARNCPRDDGDWVWIWGGPYNAHEVMRDDFEGELMRLFGEDVAAKVIAVAVSWIDKADAYEVYGGDPDDKELAGEIAAATPCEGSALEWSAKPQPEDYDDPEPWLEPERSREEAEAFYQSYEWRELRYRVLCEQGARCQCCGRDWRHDIYITVDHIFPLRLHWSLRLDPTNLQVLCNECNHGKGRWDETDWRQPGDSVTRPPRTY
jgi:hypothetical protein